MSVEHDAFARHLALKVVLYALVDAHPDKQRLLAFLDQKHEHVISDILPTAMPEDALQIFEKEVEAVLQRLREWQRRSS